MDSYEINICVLLGICSSSSKWIFILLEFVPVDTKDVLNIPRFSERPCQISNEHIPFPHFFSKIKKNKALMTLKKKLLICLQNDYWCIIQPVLICIHIRVEIFSPGLKHWNFHEKSEGMYLNFQIQTLGERL